jgi:MinD-like ATPase involved in chromosome partitioning or flagellar assembly
MTPNQDDGLGIPEELPVRQSHSFSSRALDEAVPDIPVLEPLPDADALPDPGYPVMATPVAPVPTMQQAEPAHQVGTTDPYAAPRAPDDAPPLRGPSVPWSEVRAAADHEAAGEPLPAPPVLGGHDQAEQTALQRQEGRSDAGTLTPGPSLPGGRTGPEGGWRQALYRATAGLVRVGDSAESMRQRDLAERIRSPALSGHHRVAVLSLKGGVGKTTVTAGLGATLASVRGERVIAVDGNPERGTLSDRVRLETSATIRDLLNERAMVSTYADVRAFTSRSPSGLEILASDRGPGLSAAVSADDYRAVAGVIGHYYPVCITDCGTGLLHSAMAGILELADQIVLVSSPSADGARSASAALDWLEAHGHAGLVHGGVVVLSPLRTRGGGKASTDLNRLEQHFAARCRAVVQIPYDPHLEEGTEFELEFLNPETAEAYLALAALVADSFTGS